MPTSWAPTVDDVGALLRARTKDSHGNEVGTFTADTRPTREQVESIIGRVVSDLADSITDPSLTPLPDRLAGSATRVAVLMAAAEIELSYFPEQVATGRSPYAQYRELLGDRTAALHNALADLGHDTDATGPAGGTDGGSAVAPVPPAPTGGFPLAEVRYLDDGGVHAPGSEWPHVHYPPLAW